MEVQYHGGIRGIRLFLEAGGDPVARGQHSWTRAFSIYGGPLADASFNIHEPPSLREQKTIL